MKAIAPKFKKNRISHLFLIFLFTVAFSPLFAQLPDPAVIEIVEPQPVIFANQTTPITVLIQNLGTQPALNVPVSFQVDPGGVFSDLVTVPLIDPGQTIPVSTFPNVWYPNPPGLYDIFVEISLPPTEDENLTNNFGELSVQAIPQFPIELHQLDLVAPVPIPNSTTIEVCVQVPPHPNLIYLNMMFNDPIGGDTHWGVQNLPLPPFPDPHTTCYLFDSAPLGFVEGDDITNLNIAMRIDPFIWEGPFPVDVWISDTVNDLVYNLGDINPVPVIPELPPLTVTQPIWDPVFPVDFVYHGCTIPNIELDSSMHPPSPSYAGDWNACGPAAAANSMQWLEETHPNIPQNGLTHREKMEELSDLMGRGNEEGVTTQQLIQGKLAYIDKHKLPIHVKYQSWFDTSSTIASPNPTFMHSAENKGGVGMFEPPDWNFVKSEVEKGEDVEIMFGWYDHAANRNGGHWVTVTGTFEGGGAKGIYIKDDSNQENGTGTSQTYLPWHQDGDWARLLGFDGPNNYCWVESVVSESYDPSITFDVLNPQFLLADWSDPFVTQDPLLGAFSFTFPPDSISRFVNVMANLPDSLPFWLVRNVHLPPFSTHQDMSYWLNYSWLGGLPGEIPDTLEVAIGVSTHFVDSPGFEITYDNLVLELGTLPIDYQSGRSDFNPNGILSELPTYPVYDLTLPIDTTYRGCTMPNIDLDSTNHNPINTPGYAGDKNACGPAAAANSLQWLEDTNMKIKPNGQSLREKLEDLSGLMMRNPNSTVTDENFIKGKLAFIDKHRLPIHVKFQSSLEDTSDIASPNPIYGYKAENKNDSAMAKLNWDWIMSEMKAGEDVELGIGFYDAAGNSKGGHWVTLSGISCIGGARSIQIKDDAKQKIAGGTHQEWVDWMEDTNGVPYLSGMSGNTYTVRPEIVVSESYDENITHEIFGFKFSNILPLSSSLQPHPGLSLFEFKYPPNTEPHYLNINLAWPDSPSVWVTRNVLLPPGPNTDSLSVWIDLGRLGDPFPTIPDSVRMIIGVDTIWSVDPFFDVTYEVDLKIDTTKFRVGNGAIDVASGPLPPITIEQPTFNMDTLVYEYRGCEIPNIDLDSMTNNPTNTAGYAGDANACGPVAAANSLHWLETTNPNLDSMTTHRAKLEELSEFMDRADNDGVLRKDFIEAKLAYIDKYELPIHVKFQGFYFNSDSIPSPDTLFGHFAENQNDSAFAKPKWSFLVQEMKNDEDVELEFGCYTGGTRIGGHWVTVSGVSEIGGTRSFYYKDDIRQDSAGGMGQRQVTWKDHLPTGFSYLSEFSTPDTIYVVESIVSESYDSTVNFCPTNRTIDKDPIPSGTYKSSNSLTVSGRIASGSNVTFSSPNITIIDLEVELEAILTTESTGCTNNNFKPNIPEVKDD